MHLRPLHDRVLIHRIEGEEKTKVEGEEKTKGALIVRDTARRSPSRARLSLLGKGSRVHIDGEDLLIMKESDILGIQVAAQRAA